MQTTSLPTHAPAHLTRAAVERPSLPLTVIMVGLVLAGIGWGLVLVEWWPTGQVAHRPIENRVLPHVVIGGAATFLMAHLTARRGSARWMLWPVSRGLACRVSATVRGSFADPLGPLRTLALLVLALLVGAMLLRTGVQLGLSADPGRAVNAWGGPSVVGAFAALAVDALCVVAAAYGLAHLVLRPEQAPRPLRA